MKLPERDYFRLDELANAWGCQVADIIYAAAHGQLPLGVVVFHELFYGVSEDLQTLGVYDVTGVIALPPVCAEQWESGLQAPCHPGGFGVSQAYPPTLKEGSFMAEDALSSPVLGWAPGRGWNAPETDHGRITRLMKGRDDGLWIEQRQVVAHGAERVRFEYARCVSVMPPHGRQRRENSLNELLERAYLGLRRELGRIDPPNHEVWQAIERFDTDGIIQEVKRNRIVWVDPLTAKQQIPTGYQAFCNRMANIRKRNLPSLKTS